MMIKLNSEVLEKALGLLSKLLAAQGASKQRLVVCGGSALIATQLIPRETTKDVDVVAMLDEKEQLVDPAPLPEVLLRSAAQVAETLDLPKNWLNNGPSSGEGGIYRLGLPEGFLKRLECREIPPALAVYFIGRLDQIHFKLYAAIDRGGYHLTDLVALKPTDEEIEAAARWTLTHDVSEGYRLDMKEKLRRMGHGAVADRI